MQTTLRVFHSAAIWLTLFSMRVIVITLTTLLLLACSSAPKAEPASTLEEEPTKKAPPAAREQSEAEAMKLLCDAPTTCPECLHAGKRGRSVLGVEAKYGPDIENPEEPVPVVNSRFNEDEGRISPDGRWLSYSSDESGTFEIYIRQIPLTSWKLQVSTRGGYSARWRGNSREIFFVDPTGMLSAVQLSDSGGKLSVVTTEKLFRIALPANELDAAVGYAPDPDGQRFLIRRSEIDPILAPMTVILNWTRLLERE